MPKTFRKCQKGTLKNFNYPLIVRAVANFVLMYCPV